jgi:hypothetical protein
MMTNWTELHDQGTITTEEDASFASTRKYLPRYAKEAETLLLLGATREELRRWFGVHEVFLDIWASEQKELERALQVEATTLRVIEDFGLINWLKDYRFGNLDR